MFNAVFVTQVNISLQIFEYFTEIVFLIDIILNFFQSYQDQDTFKEVREFKAIAYNYILRGWFFVDFISIFPFKFLPGIDSSANVTKLLRLFRLPRLAKLIDI